MIRCFHRELAAALALSCLAIVLAAPSAATVLTFDWTRDPSTGSVVSTASPSALPDDYGDFVSGASVAVPGGSFLYGAGGEGYTPNVTVDVYAGGATPGAPRVELWSLGFGDLENVVFALPTSSFLEVALSADPGFQVALHGFDLGGYPGTDWVINSVEVLDATASRFTQASVLVEGSGVVQHTAFAFSTPIVAPQLLIRIDFANLQPSRQDNIGLDNLRFGQSPVVVPEPAFAWLLGPGGLALAARALARVDARRHTRRRVR
jgi:hypothetical protein